MFYIKLTEDKDLQVTVREPIYRGENLNERLIFLLPDTVDELSTEASLVYLSYIRADSGADVVLLDKLEEKYNETYFQYTLPITCRLTRFPGQVCIFLQMFSGDPIDPQIVKSGECQLMIEDSKNMDDYFSDRFITALYQHDKRMKDMFKAGKECCTGVRWKNSAQKFELHLFSGTARRRKLLLTHTLKWADYVHFTISERGKTRPIDAPRIQDRQIHKVFTQKVLLPLYQPSMIYNNGASLRGKGFEFSKRQLREDLRWHFRRYGRDGWIILIDFKQFFPSVDHDEIKKRHKRYLHNREARELADDIVDTVPGGRGLPLGVEPSQTEMIAFPSAMDNYIKCQLSIKCAGHYMDDYYVIIPPDRDPKEIMRLIIEKAESLTLRYTFLAQWVPPLYGMYHGILVRFTLPTKKTQNLPPKTHQKEREMVV